MILKTTLQISPRNRQTNYPYGADAPKADIPGPYTNFRPRFADPLPQHIRDVSQGFDISVIYVNSRTYICHTSLEEKIETY